jgi:membrane associated rhomboid family serine protease
VLIPYGSDAPLYHLPIATGAMILANVLAFVGLVGLSHQVDEETFLVIYRELSLQHGHGLRPWEWITSNFVHGGILHLLGNMFCLWGFGLVVEGKIGWWRFLLVYFGIGVVQCALEQTLTLFASEGVSFGASAIIYGLMAMCVIWAPQNEMSCFLLFGFRPIFFDISLYTLGGISIIIEVVVGVLGGLSMGSQVLHLMGAGLGLAVAIVMLKRNWVDCEGWDLFNVWAGTEHKARDEEEEAAKKLVRESQEQRLQTLIGARPRDDDWTPAPAPAAPSLAAEAVRGQPSAPSQASPELTQVQQALATADPQRAWTFYQRLAARPQRVLPEAELLQIIALFHRQKLWSQSVPAMVAYLRNFAAREAHVRLWLARILVQADNRPAQALAVLAKLNESQLPESDRQIARQLRAHAQQLCATRPGEET